MGSFFLDDFSEKNILLVEFLKGGFFMNMISIVVPCYNEEESVCLFYKEFVKRTMGLRERCNFEFVFVDDGSKDNTLKEIKIIKEKIHSDTIKYISFSRNFGKEAALYAGLQAATGDFVAVMDVDLQDPPELICKMYEDVSSGEYDCVATRRQTRKGEPVLRSLFSKMFYCFINKVSETEIIDGARDFRLMNRKMVDAILSLSEKNRFSKGLFSWVGFKTKWISYDNIERAVGKTKWNFWKLFKYAIEGILGYSSFLLFISGLFFVLGEISGFVLLILSIIKHSTILALFGTVFFLFGLISLFIMFLGMYISKIDKETKSRPIYIEKERG